MADQRSETAQQGAVLVPVGESVTLRNTVAYVVDQVVGHPQAAIHFVAPVAWDEFDGVSDTASEETEELLERVAVWADEDSGNADLQIDTAIVGRDEYLFSPDDYARVLAAYADTHAIEHIVIDPEYSPGGNVPLLRPMETALARRGFTVDEAPVETPVRRPRLQRTGGILQFGALFVVAFVFYQLLSGFAIITGNSYDFYYELLTGTVVAGLVAGALHRITFARQPQFRRYAAITGRLFLFIPYLLYEIAVANLYITYIVLHPRLPIEPRLTRVRAEVWGAPSITTLANSITLTPGTLTVQTDGQYLYVHALFPTAREGLFAGGLERATRFLFYGRKSLPIASPAERDDTEIINDPDETTVEGAD